MARGNAAFNVVLTNEVTESLFSARRVAREAALEVMDLERMVGGFNTNPADHGVPLVADPNGARWKALRALTEDFVLGPENWLTGRRPGTRRSWCFQEHKGRRQGESEDEEGGEEEEGEDGEVDTPEAGIASLMIGGESEED